MTDRFSRAALVLSAFLLAAGGVIHALAFGKAAAALARVDLPAFYARAFAALWLSDSATLVLIGALYLYAALRPSSIGGVAVAFVAAVPTATALLLYGFVGNFYPGHLLIAAAALALLASLRLPRTAFAG